MVLEFHELLGKLELDISSVALFLDGDDLLGEVFLLLVTPDLDDLPLPDRQLGADDQVVFVCCQELVVWTQEGALTFLQE